MKVEERKLKSVMQKKVIQSLSFENIYLFDIIHLGY